MNFQSAGISADGQVGHELGIRSGPQLAGWLTEIRPQVDYCMQGFSLSFLAVGGDRAGGGGGGKQVESFPDPGFLP